ncbi:MAG: deoxyribodipyrimidine photo-lyase [Pseudobacteriovorax sp.]|nr:deoxyribodipyrimidine photo-lyase [Pseudobacteriovorax sp.]
MTSYGIHWFRRDLRITGNPALAHNWQTTKGNTLGLFCFDKKFLSRSDFSANRFQFFLETLQKLKDELKQYGGDLLVLDVGPEHVFKTLVQYLSAESKALPSLITWNRDYEPYATNRDSTMIDFFDKQQIAHKDFRDHLIIEPHELEKAPGEGYQVYSPFARKWMKIIREPEFWSRIQSSKASLDKYKSKSDKPRFGFTWNEVLDTSHPFKDQLETYREDNRKHVDIPIPKAGFASALETLDSFKTRIDNYKPDRDMPSINGTSRLSHFVKNGSITTSQIVAYLGLNYYDKREDGRDTYFSELVWREFYYHILSRHKRVEQEAFLPKYKDIAWDNNKEWFDQWKKGTTGFPIVDAGMRELNTTGHMHNRVRMIVSSFLTKDLLINWQWGEQYFMEKLLDGDLAANNGGWQWAASTGCDPQPYFRIFNPWLQSKKFDPEGVYIKTYLPELKDLNAKELHKPILSHKTYPEPIVDHSKQRELALELYKRY